MSYNEFVGKLADALNDPWADWVSRVGMEPSDDDFAALAGNMKRAASDFLTEHRFDCMARATSRIARRKVGKKLADFVLSFELDVRRNSDGELCLGTEKSLPKDAPKVFSTTIKARARASSCSN